MQNVRFSLIYDLNKIPLNKLVYILLAWFTQRLDKRLRLRSEFNKMYKNVQQVPHSELKAKSSFSG